MRRGLLYPKPKERYERFRLNPYSPLYHCLVAAVMPQASSTTRQSTQELLSGRLGYMEDSGGVIELMPAPGIGRLGVRINKTRQRIDLFAESVIPATTTITLCAWFRPEEYSGNWHAAIGTYADPCMIIGCSSTTTSRLCARSTSDYYGTVLCDYSNGLSQPTILAWEYPSTIVTSAQGRPFEVRTISPIKSDIKLRIRLGSIQTAFTGIGIVSDLCVWQRLLSLSEWQAYSDPDNVDLRVPNGPPLILPVRTYWPSVVAAPPQYLKRRSLGLRVGTREALI